MNFAAFILSTGRCGTQWIAKTLGDTYPDRLAVEHEPLDNDYGPRKALRRAGRTADMPDLPLRVQRHIDDIETRLRQKSYLECGHPCWSTLGALAQRFEGRIRIIHLTRHPVTTCYSWLSQQAYAEPFLPHQPKKTLLSPFDEGTEFSEYRQRWDGLTAFEKCLYYWSEVNAFGIDLQSRSDVPWLRLKYEDLFHGDGACRLLEFLDLPARDSVFVRTDEIVDEYRFHLIELQDRAIVEHHPVARSIARQLDYDLDEVDESELQQRFLHTGQRQP